MAGAVSVWSCRIASSAVWRRLRSRAAETRTDASDVVTVDGGISRGSHDRGSGCATALHLIPALVGHGPDGRQEGAPPLQKARRIEEGRRVPVSTQVCWMEERSGTFSANTACEHIAAGRRGSVAAGRPGGIFTAASLAQISSLRQGIVVLPGGLRARLYYCFIWAFCR